MSKGHLPPTATRFSYQGGAAEPANASGASRRRAPRRPHNATGRHTARSLGGDCAISRSGTRCLYHRQRQRASVAKRRFALPPEQGMGATYAAISFFTCTRDYSGCCREPARMRGFHTRRARAEFAETRAAALKSHRRVTRFDGQGRCCHGQDRRRHGKAVVPWIRWSRT
jgi:hypothetical protein